MNRMAVCRSRKKLPIRSFLIFSLLGGVFYNQSLNSSSEYLAGSRSDSSPAFYTSGLLLTYLQELAVDSVLSSLKKEPSESFKASHKREPNSNLRGYTSNLTQSERGFSEGDVTFPSLNPADYAQRIPSEKNLSNIENSAKFECGGCVAIKIDHSLRADALKAGLSLKEIDTLVQLFSSPGSINVLHKGDILKVVTSPEKETILGVQLNGHQIRQFIQFTDPTGHTGYYNAEGESLEESISRAPLNFKQISSKFSNSRLNPVLKFSRPHFGVDYSAPMGTPIYAAGEGIIRTIQSKQGYGKTIVMEHKNHYTTVYAHLAGFKENLKLGETVKKGQIIGYVGKTGFATGAHLHFEIRLNDIAVDPLTTALPKITLSEEYKALFFEQSKPVVAKLLE